jgi:glycosyltransferase 2 family protein
MRGRLPRLLGYLALAVSLGYLGAVALRHSSSFPEVVWSSRAVAAFAGAMGLYLVMLVAGFAAWFLLLRSAGSPVSLRAVLILCGLAQAGKYLPGNVGQYLGRAALARQQGIPLHTSTLTMLFETAGLIVTALACALLGGTRAAASLPPPWQIALLAAAALAAPFLLVRAVELWFPAALHKRLGVERLTAPSIPALGACLALYAVCFVCGGLSFEVLARGLFDADPAGAWTRVIPAFALSWVAGFVTPGAPAGLGVREALLVGGTASFYGPGTALSAALASRLVTVLGDGLAFLAGAAARRWYDPS